MDIRFDGKRALVTGAGQGIGRCIAKALAAGGAQVIALSRNQQRLDNLKAEVPSIDTVTADVTDWEATRAAVQSLGPIDLLVNNAGVAVLGSCLEQTPQDFDLVFNVNVKAVMNVTQVVAKGMVERGSGGSVVNISSMAGKVSLQDHLVYCSSKGALEMMTHVFAFELGPHNIRVNSIAPTVVMTEMGRAAWKDPAKADPLKARIPLGKFAEESDVVNATLFLLSDKAAMVTGSMLPVDGGYMVG